MNPEKIGKFICELRKEKGLSQYELADMIPISRQGVSKWERGVTTPDPQTLMQLAEMFNVTIDELLRGERSEVHTIEKLEETTLSILDQSNKKTKTIKRITTISISIIIILLLTFLSYYFINSYNSMEVYKIGNTNDKFTTNEGIYITTREKYYLRLGKIKNKIDANINNVKLYYKKGKEKILIVEDTEADELVIIDSYGYGEKFSKKDIEKLKDNLYLEITYNETEVETIKLRYRRKYNNSSLFFMNQKVGKKKEIVNDTKVEQVTTPEEKKPEEEKKEEVKPTIQEETSKQETTSTQPATPQPTEEPQQEEPAPEPVITTDMAINKIKEVCPNTNGTYSCDFDNSTVLIMYYSFMNRITIYKNSSLIGHYSVNIDNYVCLVDDCETIFNETFKEYLFS